MPETIVSLSQVDLVRCKGLWYHSIRYGFIFGVNRGGFINYDMPSFADFQAVAQDASKIFEAMANAMKTKDVIYSSQQTCHCLTFHA